MHKEWRHKIYKTAKTATRRMGWADSTVRRLERAVAAGGALLVCTNWQAASGFVWVRVTDLYWERVEAMQQADCDEEGRPDLTPLEWCEWYAGGDKTAEVLVIKFAICCALLGCVCSACS
jgi:hypothetical protein